MKKTDKPEGIKPGRLVETTGTCKYCHNLVTIKALPEATEEEKDEIASAVISCLKPVAYGKLDKITVKVDEATTIKIYRSTKGLNLKRTVKEDDIMDEWSPS